MYEIQINGETLYYPSNMDYAILNTSLQLDIGLSGELTFDVPVSNPIYERIGQGLIITILRDNKEYWRGEIREVKTAMDKTKSVYCLEDLSWLADEFLAPTSITNETYAQRFQAAINAYNANRTADRRFEIGYLTNVSSGDKCTWNTEYDWSILDSLRNCICKDTGYIRVRRVTSGGTVTRYIDIVRLSDYGVKASQPITFGVNLLDYLQKMDLGNLTNVLTPYGAEIEGSELYPEHAQRMAGTPIENAASIARYGRHAKAVIFETESESTLNRLAEAYLTRYSVPQLTMEIKAIDLAEISNDAHFEIGDSIHIIADPFNIDQEIYLTKQTIDLQDASKNEITLSSHISRGSTMTQQTADTTELIKSLPSKASILDAAKKNTLKMLLDETQGGYVVYEYHETDGKADYIEAINICNQPTINDSTSRWRWSYNGLGFLSRSSVNVDWNYSNIPIALTNKGEINADRILTGTLDADTVTVHGKIEATSGYIGGETQGWEIGAKSIYNGTDSLTSGVNGMYIGTDGIHSKGSSRYTKIYDGWIDTTSIISANGYATKGTGAVVGYTVEATGGGFKADGLSGATGQITWVVDGTGYSINVKNGIVIGIART